MNRKMINCFSILILTAGIVFSSAQVEVTEPLTLEKALKIAMAANIDLKQAVNNVSQEQNTVIQKKASFYPDLSISATTTQRFGKEYETVSGSYIASDSNSLGISASSSLNIFNGFYDTASLQQSRLQLNASEEMLSRTRQAVLFDVIDRFFQVVTAREAIDVEKENLEAQRLQLIRVDSFVLAGRRPRADLLQQKSEIAAAEYRILNAERNYQIKKLLLKQSLGIEADSDYSVAVPDIDKLLEQVLQYNKDRDVESALVLRPDVIAVNLEVEAAKKGVKAARSGYLPKLSLFADLGTSYNSQIGYAGFSDQFMDGNINGAIGLSLSIPVFDKSRTKTNVAMAQIVMHNRQLEKEKLEKQVGVDVQQSIQDYVTARKQIDVTTAQLVFTKEALDSVQERYNVDAATMVELIQARSMYLDAHLGQVEAKFNLLVRGIAAAFYKGDSSSMLSLLDLNNVQITN